VFVRLKPKAREQKEREILQVLNPKTIKIDENYFCFDEIFNQEVKQEAIFDNVGAHMCKQLFDGYNGTIFAYGQTGSGKTYTIFG
jgi:Cdc6-like AAA superfamily ATPase